MDDRYCRLLFCALLGIGCSKALQKWQDKRIKREKLKMINEALEQAEFRLSKYEERHDQLLQQVCSYYLVNQNLEDALTNARKALTEALQFADALRTAQMELITSFPGERHHISVQKVKAQRRN